MLYVYGSDSRWTTLFCLSFLVLTVFFAGRWKAFEKLGVAGYWALVPVFGTTRLNDRLIVCGNPYKGDFMHYYLGVALAFGFNDSVRGPLKAAFGLAFMGYVWWPRLGFGPYGMQSFSVREDR